MCYNNCLMNIFTKWFFLVKMYFENKYTVFVNIFYCLSCEIPYFVYHGTFWCVNRKRGSVFKKIVFRLLYLNIPRYRRSSCWSSRFFVTYLLLWSTAICCGPDIKCETVPEVDCHKMALYGSSIGCDIKLCTEFRAENLVLTL